MSGALFLTCRTRIQWPSMPANHCSAIKSANDQQVLAQPINAEILVAWSWLNCDLVNLKVVLQ